MVTPEIINGIDTSVPAHLFLIQREVDQCFYTGLEISLLKTTLKLDKTLHFAPITLKSRYPKLFKDETLQLDLRKKQSRIFKNHFQGDTRNR